MKDCLRRYDKYFCSEKYVFVNINNKNLFRPEIKSNVVNSSKMLNTNVDMQVNIIRQLMNKDVLAQPSYEFNSNNCFSTQLMLF